MRTKQRLRAAESGIALVIMLAFIVLVTVITVAFFSKATLNSQIARTSATQAASEQLANSGLEVIVADLQQEIRAGSDPTTILGMTSYRPKTQGQISSAVPLRYGADPAAIPNLVRRSTATDPNYSSPPSVYQSNQLPENRASLVSSATPSSNRRSISTSRWNKHLLVPRANPASPTDPAPTAAFTAPDWVYVTRTGPRTITWSDKAKDSALDNDDYVLGRYAYAIYDEGGLLDINVAGYPDPQQNAQDLRQVGRKGRAVLADLTVLGLTRPQVDNLVGWRNYASLEPSGSFGSYQLDANSKQKYFTLIDQLKSGFLTINPVVFGGTTDQAILSRQDLLRLRNSLGFSLDALQYLGTFSRDTNAPSYTPIATRGSPDGCTVDYAELALSPAAANRDLLNVRAEDSFTRQDGSQALAGEPLVKRRFSLSKLKWVTSNGPSASLAAGAEGYDADGTSAAVEAAFGLRWEPSNNRWIYFQGTDRNNDLKSEIKTLAEVAAERREPNFFELLNAGILSGSIAQEGGNTALQTQEVDSSTAVHILRIGANIIDQSDADSFPTAIALDGYLDAIGIEDLPYVHRILDVVYRPGQDVNLGAWRCFEMWNPHQKTSSVATQPGPTDFRIVGKQGSVEVIAEYVRRAPRAGSPPGQTWSNRFYWNNPDVNNAEYPTPNARFNPNGNPGYLYRPPFPAKNLNPQSDFIQFSTQNPDWHYRSPVVLNQWSGPYAGPGSNTYNPAHKYAGSATAEGNNKVEDTWQRFLGLSAIGTSTGSVSAPDGRYSAQASDPVYTFVSIRPSLDPNSPRVTYELQYLKSGGNPQRPEDYLPCQSLPISSQGYLRVFDDGGNADTAGNRSGYMPRMNSTIQSARSLGKPHMGMIKVDPRTTRFGASEVYAQFEGNGGMSIRTSFAFAPNSTSRASKTDVDGKIATNFVPQGALFTNTGAGVPPPQTYGTTARISQLAENRRDRSFFYRDHDGVVRPGDAFRTADNTGGLEDGSALSSNNPTNATTNNEYSRKPVVLNRPFRSVGELCYAFRDLPWKTLDFATEYSADAGLLDLFSVDDADVVAGRVNLNGAQPKVFEALLAGTLKQEFADVVDANTTLAAGTEAKLLAEALADQTDEALTDRSQLVTKFSQDPDVKALLDGNYNNRTKHRREAYVRALSEAGTTRTWNLMIDLVAQAGRFNKNSTSLEQFHVEGETRYWLHVAIDRHTGKVIGRQLEVVYE